MRPRDRVLPAILISFSCLSAAPCASETEFDRLLRDELRAGAAYLSDPAARESVVAAFRDAGAAGRETARELLRSESGGGAAEAARLVSELGTAEAEGALLACAASHVSSLARETCERLSSADVRIARRIARAENLSHVLGELESLRGDSMKAVLLEELALQADPRRVDVLASAIARLPGAERPASLRRLAERVPAARAARLREWATALDPSAVVGCERLLPTRAILLPIIPTSAPARDHEPRALHRARALLQGGDVRDVAELRRLLRHHRADVRVVAAQALVLTGDPAGIPVLLHAIPGTEPNPLARITGRSTTLETLAEFAGRDVASGLADPSPQEVMAAWRAWWADQGDGFDALAAHVRFLSDGSGRPSFSILERAGTLETARAILEWDIRDVEMTARTLCRISARHAAVTNVLREHASDSNRGFSVLAIVDRPAARALALALIDSGDPAAIDRAQELCAWGHGACGDRVIDAVVARLPELSARAELPWRLRLPLRRTHCPALERAALGAASENVRSHLAEVARRTECRSTTLLIVRQSDGSVALQRCGGSCDSGEPLLGRPATIADWSADRERALTRHGMACAEAELVGARTVVGLALALASDEPFDRYLAASALETLAELSPDLAPECVDPPDPRGAAVLDAPFLRARLEEAAAATDPEVAAAALRILARSR